MIAEKEIPCFKVVTKSPTPNVLNGYYHEFTYQLGQGVSLGKELVVESKFCTTPYDTYETFYVNEGFHSYSEDVNIYSLRSSIVVHHGLINLDLFPKTMTDKLMVMKCVIPKGCHYLLNESRGEYVSDGIRPIKCVELSKIAKNWR